MLIAKTTLSTLFLLNLATSVLAQETSPTLLDLFQDYQQPIPPSETLDLEISGHVKARELIFHSDPETRIQFFGTANRQTGWVVERQNLPQANVQPGVLYENIDIEIKIYSAFEEVVPFQEQVPPEFLIPN